MATTGTSNNPHVRLTPDVHYDLRRYSVLTGRSQGEIIADLLREKLEEEGNPHLVLNLPPRQKRKTRPVKAAVAPPAPRRPPGRPRTRPIEQPPVEPPRRGRPPGSKNQKPAPAPAPLPKRRSSQRQSASTSR